MLRPYYTIQTRTTKVLAISRTHACGENTGTPAVEKGRTALDTYARKVAWAGVTFVGYAIFMNIAAILVSKSTNAILAYPCLAVIGIGTWSS
jgi:hypothetical protein